MLPPDTRNYITEIARVMKPGATCVATFFLITPESTSLIAKGQSRLDFNEALDDCRINHSESPELAVAYDEKMICALFQKNYLNIVRPISFGSWCGSKDGLSYQDIIIATRAE